MDINDEAEWIGIANDKTDTARAFFRRDYVIDKPATEREGRVVTKEVERVRIVVPGDDKSQIDRKVQPEDKDRWPEAYARFKNRETPGVVNGTPLEEWPYLTKEWVAKLKYLEFRAVEDIANASDTALDKLGAGARDLQKRAREFLTPASENEQNWRQEKQSLENRIKALEAEKTQMLNSEPVEKRKPGRPRKAA